MAENNFCNIDSIDADLEAYKIATDAQHVCDTVNHIIGLILFGVSTILVLGMVSYVLIFIPVMDCAHGDCFLLVTISYVFGGIATVMMIGFLIGGLWKTCGRNSSQNDI